MHPAFRVTVILVALGALLDAMSPGAGRYALLLVPVIVAILARSVWQAWTDYRPRRPKTRCTSTQKRPDDASRLR